MTTITTPGEQPEPTADDGGFVWSNEDDADNPEEELVKGLTAIVLILAGIGAAGALLYFREQVWAWATGDPVTFTIVLFMLTVGSVLTIRAARESEKNASGGRDGVEP